MDKQNKVDGNSRRKFIKIAAATAYVAPLIASMPAHATFKSNGSKTVTKKVWPKKKIYRKIFKYKRYSKYNRYNKYRRW